jgi:hypothetical protein
LVWDADRAYARDGVYCDLVLRHYDLLPGGQWSYSLPVQVRRVLGDSLPAGTYSFTVSAFALQPAKADEMPAGQLTLTP